MPHFFLMVPIVAGVLLLLLMLVFFGFIGKNTWIFRSNVQEDTVLKEHTKNSEVLKKSETCDQLNGPDADLVENSSSEEEEQEDEILKIIHENLQEPKETDHQDIDPIDSFLKVSTSESASIQPEGSPKSTSSCISSELPEEMDEISRPSSFASSISSTIPIFEFTRKTPEFIPRMMTEEFESLDRSIEKRKLDIRDLLKRIESAKRRHQKFTQHLQRVQHDHQFD